MQVVAPPNTAFQTWSQLPHVIRRGRSGVKLGGAANEARHRAENNCIIVKIPASSKLVEGATALMATKDIAVDEECLVDYGDTGHVRPFRGSEVMASHTGDGGAPKQDTREVIADLMATKDIAVDEECLVDYGDTGHVRPFRGSEVMASHTGDGGAPKQDTREVIADLIASKKQMLAELYAIDRAQGGPARGTRSRHRV